MKKTRDIPRRQRRWVATNLSGARFHNVNLTDATIRGAILVNVEIDGFVRGLTVNGVDVGPLVEQELDRRHPERPLLRADDPDGLRDAWSMIEGTWADTMARAQRLPEERLHERVDDEWSFVETLRHLVFVTDAWIGRPVLGRQHHYDPAGLAHTDLPSWFVEACALDPTVAPALADVIEARAVRMAEVRDLVDHVTPSELDRRCPRNPAPGYPADPRKVTVRDCLQTTLREEWEHHRFAVRDLQRLEQP